MIIVELVLFTLISLFSIISISGDISLDKLLLNIKKIGAADLTGVIKSDNKFTVWIYNIFDIEESDLFTKKCGDI